MRESYLPFALPDIDERELTEVEQALLSGWVTTGPKTHQFEQEFAAAIGARHAIAVNSCTAAMHLALEAVGLQPGDEVITTPLTFAATAEVVRYFDARPVLVDVDAETLNIDTAQIDAAINERTRVIMPVHLAGLPANMAEISRIAQQHALKVIEDAAHAMPGVYNHRAHGSLGDLVCFSFYATKTLTTGEGGMICTENEEWAERCRFMSLHGISRDAWKRYTAEGNWYYEILAPGFKYNMTDVAAAMGLAQLRKVNVMWQRRKEIAAAYNQAFAQVSELLLPPVGNAPEQHAWHLYILRLHLERLQIDRSQFIAALKKRNIGTSVHFIPLHIHPYYRQRYGYQPQDYPVSYREYQRMISLPIYSRMSDQDVQDVIEAVSEIVVQNRTA